MHLIFFDEAKNDPDYPRHHLGADTEFHAAEIYRRKKNFEDWKDVGERFALIAQFVDLLSMDEVDLIESCLLPAPKPRAFSTRHRVKLTLAFIHPAYDSDRIQSAAEPTMPDDIISLTDFKNDASGWIERLQSQPPVVLTQNGRGRAVVLSYDAFRAMQAEVALLTRLSRAEDDLKAGRAKPQEKVLAQARARLARRLAKRPAAHGAA